MRRNGKITKLEKAKLQGMIELVKLSDTAIKEMGVEKRIPKVCYIFSFTVIILALLAVVHAITF